MKNYGYVALLPCSFCGSQPVKNRWPEGSETGECHCVAVGPTFSCPIEDVDLTFEEWNTLQRFAATWKAQTNPVAVVPDERKAFEEWWRANMNIEVLDLHRNIYPMDSGWSYACYETNRAWMTWQARAFLNSEPKP